MQKATELLQVKLQGKLKAQAPILGEGTWGEPHTVWSRLDLNICYK
jgi:hypothetical protein